MSKFRDDCTEALNSLGYCCLVMPGLPLDDPKKHAFISKDYRGVLFIGNLHGLMDDPNEPLDFKNKTIAEIENDGWKVD